ncbi:MAG: hypothetical protein JRJ78_16835, partial [Deltaproteobacteria bacterium]|nr:hypothetical protein [Deltaproteobacteria bacterium]
MNWPLCINLVWLIHDAANDLLLRLLDKNGYEFLELLLVERKTRNHPHPPLVYGDIREQVDAVLQQFAAGEFDLLGM